MIGRILLTDRLTGVCFVSTRDLLLTSNHITFEVQFFLFAQREQNITKTLWTYLLLSPSCIHLIGCTAANTMSKMLVWKDKRPTKPLPPLHHGSQQQRPTSMSRPS